MGEKVEEAIQQLLKELQDHTIMNKNWEQTSWRLVKMMDICKRIQQKYPHVWGECVTKEEIRDIFNLKG